MKIAMRAPAIAGFSLAIAASFLIAAAHAQAPAKPHEPGPMASGVIKGRLLKEGKPMPGHEVVLEVMRQGVAVLSIPKAADVEGRYQFKNIFQSPEFSYAVSAEFEGEIYRTPFISLKAGQGEARLDLKVGPGQESAAGIGEEDTGAEAQGAGPQMERHEHLHKESTAEYKLLAVILSIAAVGLALWQKKRA